MAKGTGADDAPFSLPLRDLDLQLMRVVLRPFPSPEHTDEEGRLLELIQRRFHFRDDDERQELCLRWLVRWRSGRLTCFTFAALRWARTDLQRGRAAPAVALPPDVATAHAGPAEQAMLLDVFEAFRAGLSDPTEVLLLEAWVRGGRQGWQREFARSHAKTDGWVTRALGRFRATLARSHGVADADLLVEAVASLRASDDGPPPPPAPPSGGSPLAFPRGRATLLRERLRASFPDGSRERRFMDDSYDSYPPDELRQRYPDEPGLLARLHARYVRLGREMNEAAGEGEDHHA